MVAETTALSAGSRPASLPRRAEGVLSGVPLHPVLLGAYLVLLVYSNNLAEIPPSDVLVPLAVVALVAGLLTIALAVVLHDPPRAGLLATSLLVPFLAFAFIRDAVSSYWSGDDRILALSLVVIMSALVIAMERMRSRIPTLTLALNVVSALVVAMVLVPIVSYVNVAWSRSEGVVDTSPVLLATVPKSGADESTRDIYHLVFDRYGSNDALWIGHGIDNAPFTRSLESQGFHVVDDARANYRGSAMSLAATLGMSLLDEIAAQMGPDVGYYGPILERLEHSRVGAWLQDRGYEYHHIGSWYPPTASSAIADRSYGPRVSNDLATTLIDNSVLPVILDPFPSADRRHADAAEYQFEVLEGLVVEPAEQPRYVFAHVLVPHPPYVFSADGAFMPDDADAASQLEYTNARIRSLVDQLLDRPPDERPIIILQADEGPYPDGFYDIDSDFAWESATDDELAMLYGVLNAMYLPGPEGEQGLPASMTLVNTYPEVLDRYFDEGIPRQLDRSWASRTETPYALTEVTDRLDAIAGSDR